MEHNMVLSYSYCQYQNQLCDKRTAPLQPISMALLTSQRNAAYIAQEVCSWLPWKPLDAAIGQVFTLFHPGSHQGDNNQSNNQKLYHIPWWFWWPWWCTGTIPPASSNRKESGLQQRPLVATTGWVLRLIVATSHAYTTFFRVFSSSTCYKRTY